jgi:hypothetical protein
LTDVGVLAHHARRRVSRADGHDELISRPSLAARPYARCPLSRAGKEIILDDDTNDVGVDAVLSADVGDAPMRQRQYTARVARRCQGLPPIASPTRPDQFVGCAQGEEFRTTHRVFDREVIA